MGIESVDNYNNKLKNRFGNYATELVAIDGKDILFYVYFNSKIKEEDCDFKIIKEYQCENYALCSYPLIKL